MAIVNSRLIGRRRVVCRLCGEYLWDYDSNVIPTLMQEHICDTCRDIRANRDFRTNRMRRVRKITR